MYHKYVLWNNLKKMNLIYFYTQFIVYKRNELEIKAPHILSKKKNNPGYFLNNNKANQ